MKPGIKCVIDVHGTAGCTTEHKTQFVLITVHVPKHRQCANTSIFSEKKLKCDLY